MSEQRTMSESTFRAAPGEEHDLPPTRPLPEWVVWSALTAVGAVIHFATLTASSDVPVWFDEAHTEWMVRGSFGETARRCAAEVYPPLYFWLLKPVVAIFGNGETALRLLSAIAATAVTPALCLIVRRWFSFRTAVVAGLVTAFCPLLNYYAAEARCYAFLALMCALTLGSYLRAIESPGRMRNWGALAACLGVAHYTHHYVAFLCPVPTLTTLFLPIPHRVRTAAKVLAASVAAFLPYSWWFYIAVTAGEGMEWISPSWIGWRPYLAVFESLELFGPAPNLVPRDVLPGVGAALSGLVLILATLRWRDSTSGSLPPAVLKRALWGFLLIPLLIPFAYSHLRQPIYYPGRYDIIALPPFLMLFALGIDKLLDGSGTRRAAWAAMAGSIVAGLWVDVATVATAPHMFVRQRDPVTIREIGRHASADDLVVCVGHRYLVASYHARRANLPAELAAFPRDVLERPGLYWHKAARYVRDPARLPADARHVAAAVIQRLERGKNVWLLDDEESADANSRFLIEELRPRVALQTLPLPESRLPPGDFANYRAVLRPAAARSQPSESASSDARR